MVRERLSAENEIVASLRRIIRAVDLHSRQLLDKYGLTGPQLVVLQEVAHEGGAPASELARAVHLSRPTVTGILDRLGNQGLIERSPHPRDRRSQQVLVTPAGRKMLATAPSLLQTRFREELASLEDWERSMILATLQRIAALMDAETIPAAPMLVTGPVGSGSLLGASHPPSDLDSSDSLHLPTKPGKGN